MYSKVAAVAEALRLLRASAGKAIRRKAMTRRDCRTPAGAQNMGHCIKGHECHTCAIIACHDSQTNGMQGLRRCRASGAEWAELVTALLRGATQVRRLDNTSWPKHGCKTHQICNGISGALGAETSARLHSHQLQQAAGWRPLATGPLCHPQANQLPASPYRQLMSHRMLM